MKQLEKNVIPAAEEIISSPFCFRAVLPGNIHVPGIIVQEKEPSRSGPDDLELIESIRTHGIIEPPLIIRRDGENCIVTGHRRLAAAAAAGLTDTDMLVMGTDIPEDTVPAGILNIWLESARGGTVLSELEKLLLLSRAKVLAGPDLEDLMPILSDVFGRDINSTFAEKLLTLLDLTPPVRTALHNGRMRTGDLLSLGSHSSIDIDVAAGLLLGEKMSRGGMKKAIKLILYLADQHGTEWKNILVSSSESTPPLAVRLGKACYPHLEKDTTEIVRMIDSIGLPEEASINPPDNLEGGSYSLNIRIRDEARFSVILEKLSSALSAGRIERLLKILKGK
ncbi:MAG: ParB N-terminal domain-containing protein [Bacteroidales bacterium]|nr:ParB N-terminal domain-containing protein [Candidatus Latescibacterota bacterium]